MKAKYSKCMFTLIFVFILIFITVARNQNYRSKVIEIIPADLRSKIPTIALNKELIHGSPVMEEKRLNEQFRRMQKFGRDNGNTSRDTIQMPVLGKSPLEKKVQKQIEALLISNSANELKILQKIVDHRISELQKLTTCDEKRKRLICKVPARCGLGCTLHHIGVCFFIAIGTNRTMSVEATGFPYVGIDDIIEDVSLKCTKNNKAKIVPYKGELSKNPTSPEEPIVSITMDGAKSFDTIFAAFTIPAGLFDRLSFVHARPDIWWIGQIMKYLTRVKPWVNKRIDNVAKSLDFSHPIAGIHVRRTDKLLREAKFHALAEYMNHVTKWYDRYDMIMKIKVTRKVYIATDEPKVLEDAKKTYPSYTFIHNPALFNKAITRYTKDGLLSTVTDVKLLKACDYFVGTYSSNIGRVVYALRQADGDRTYDSVSIDFHYYYVGGHPQEWVATEDHIPNKGEIELRKGDRIEFDMSRLDIDFGYGVNKRTKTRGKFPIQKVKDIFVPAPYPGLS